MNEFRTYWLIAHDRYDDWPEVERLVLAGDVAVEVPAEQQQAEHEARQEAKRLYRERQTQLERFAIRNAYERSTLGQREAALREAARRGSRVTLVTADDQFAELDSYSREQTNPFNR